MMIRLALWYLIFTACTGNPRDIDLEALKDLPAGTPFTIRLTDPVPQNRVVALLPVVKGDTLWLQVYRDDVYIGRIPDSGIAPSAYRLTDLPAPTDRVNVEKQLADSTIIFRVGERPVLRYQWGEKFPADTLPDYYRRSGFFHPVLSPAGDTLTDGFPAGHTHQHGMFTAWVNTRWRGRKVDFWNQQAETGTVRHLALDTLQSGPVFARLVVRLEHIARPDHTVLAEDWELLVYPGKDQHIWDLHSTQRNISSDTLHLLPYHYGGLGIRGAKQWNAVDRENYLGPARFVSPEGINRDSLNHSRPAWLAMYGPTLGGEAGLAVFDHPQNPEYPQPVRVHPVMPYFSYTAVVGQGIDLPPGAELRFRYRFISYDGAPDTARLDSIAKAFADELVFRPRGE